MLSRREREFLTNPEKFTGNYARWLRYSIKRKMRKIIQGLELISQKWSQALENLQTPILSVRENSNVKNLISHEETSEKGVWGNLSLNAGPGGLEPPTPGLEGFFPTSLCRKKSFTSSKSFSVCSSLFFNKNLYILLLLKLSGSFKKSLKRLVKSMSIFSFPKP